MDRLPALLLALIVAVIILSLGGILSESIAYWLYRRFNRSYEGSGILMWGLAVLSAFAFGLIVMYLLLR